MVLSRSVDGFTAGTPLESLTDDGLDAILAVGMNGEPLPLEHGFPVRMVVPGLYGYVSATKWLSELKVTTFDADEAYWTPRGYSAKAPIKFSSRLDTPNTGEAIPAGRTPIAGVAWAQTVGIDRVEVSIDDGQWQSATLSTPINDDTWVQWFVDWDATVGTHYVAVRAVEQERRCADRGARADRPRRVDRMAAHPDPRHLDARRWGRVKRPPGEETSCDGEHDGSTTALRSCPTRRRAGRTLSARRADRRRRHGVGVAGAPTTSSSGKSP